MTRNFHVGCNEEDDDDKQQEERTSNINWENFRNKLDRNLRPTMMTDPTPEIDSTTWKKISANRIPGKI